MEEKIIQFKWKIQNFVKVSPSSAHHLKLSHPQVAGCQVADNMKVASPHRTTIYSELIHWLEYSRQLLIDKYWMSFIVELLNLLANQAGVIDILNLAFDPWPPDF